MNLFDFNNDINKQIPLAEKMRPKNLNEFFGQKHLLGMGKILRRIIESDNITSMILQGPPSSGKTSLANIISHMTQSEFVSLNAVQIGVSDIKETISKAKDNLRFYNKKTIVFLDEIHALRSNVQMSLLPVVEDGTITLIGSTTESIMHDIIPPLASRCRVYHFNPLSKGELQEIIQIALTDPDRGIGDLNVEIEEEALDYVVDICNGDIRSALNAIEVSAYSLFDSKTITLKHVQEAFQFRLNKTSTTDFYDLTSAFIKSIRAGHTDGALYWLARMLYAGVDPVFIARRVVISSSEDIGMANPHALQICIAAKQAVEFVGMPEARIPLAQAVVYLCESPKSNSAYKGINKALKVVENTNAYPVPDQLKNSSGLYVNPIDNPDSQLEYLPKELKESKFYVPQNSGVESKIHLKYNARK